MAATTFPWTETEDRLREVLADHRLERGDDGRSWVAEGLVFTPPWIQDRGAEWQGVDDFLASLDDPPGIHAIALVRAGATSLGVWDDDELLAHKAFKRYVVRGNGKAQQTHLSTKGKSRYGSRLRLQNARRQLEETNERLVDWAESYGPFRFVLAGGPRRLWSDLRATKPDQPFDEAAISWLPFHTHTPTHEELLRVRRKVVRGRIEIAEPE